MSGVLLIACKTSFSRSEIMSLPVHEFAFYRDTLVEALSQDDADE